MTNQDRVFLVVALVALALVALATSVSLLLARRRAQLRAPLATALTFSLLAIATASGIGALAVLQESEDLAVVAGAVALVAALSLARVGMLRREHGALVGGNAAVGEARGAARAARALVAATRLAERLDGASSLDEIDVLLSDAARRALPDAVVAIVAGDVPHDGPFVDVPLRSGEQRAIRATWAAAPPHGREDVSAAEVVLRALASEATLGVERLHGRQAAEAEIRRRDVTAALGERLRGADDAFGACHLAAQTAGSELGARNAAIEAAGVHATFTLEGDKGGEHELVVPFDGGGTLTLSLPTEPGDSDRAVAAGIGDALQRALTIHAARRLAEERSARQAAVAAAARSVHGQIDGMLRGVAEAARGALEADATVIYTLGADGPVALEAVGTGLPDACDGVAAQAIATARSVVDADGRFLASSPGELACGVAVPLPGGGERGAISVLYRAKRPLGERDAEDLAAFAQIAALAIDRATLERELDRREVLRAGFVEITDALAGTREPARPTAPWRPPPAVRCGHPRPSSSRSPTGSARAGPRRPRRRSSTMPARPARCCSWRRARAGSCCAPTLRPTAVCQAPSGAGCSRRASAPRSASPSSARPAWPPCSASCGRRRMPRVTTTSIWHATSAPPPRPPSSAPRRWRRSGRPAPAPRSCSGSAA